ncbi:MAG: FUSC family protein [Lachnospiraceae bacterium]|nr:FUSC family protein [Lachnospiraceae bacterium]
MFIKYSKLRIGPRTLKTAFAVTLSIVMVSFYGSSTSNLIFATIGALSAMGATFKESLESCFSQIAGVLFGVFAGVLLLSFHMHPLLASGIGIIIVITFYNLLRLKISPTLACIVVVTICNLTSTTPFIYAIERIWDTAIGLFIGMLINLFIFPYDNSKQIRNTIHRLDRELILYLEDMFDGDENLPNVNKMVHSLDEIEHGLKIFSDQKLLFRLKKQKNDLSTLLDCEEKARQLVLHLEILSSLSFPGILNPYNKERLERNGANPKDQRVLDEPTELDIVTNYHVSQVLNLRRELINALREN